MYRFFYAVPLTVEALLYGSAQTAKAHSVTSYKGVLISLALLQLTIEKFARIVKGHVSCTPIDLPIESINILY